jgi:hypothetical protein
MAPFIGHIDREVVASFCYFSHSNQVLRVSRSDLCTAPDQIYLPVRSLWNLELPFFIAAIWGTVHHVGKFEENPVDMKNIQEGIGHIIASPAIVSGTFRFTKADDAPHLFAKHNCCAVTAVCYAYGELVFAAPDGYNWVRAALCAWSVPEYNLTQIAHDDGPKGYNVYHGQERYQHSLKPTP